MEQNHPANLFTDILVVDFTHDSATFSVAAAVVAIFAGAMIAANNFALWAGKYMQAQNMDYKDDNWGK